MSYLEGLFTLRGRRALVTGAAGGIGGASVRALAGAGASVGLVDIPGTEERLQERADALVEEFGATAVAVVADVSAPDDVRRIVEEVAGRLGGLDVVHSNAGVITGLEQDLAVEYEAWRHNVDVNLDGVFLVGREAARTMVQQATGGSIINTASMSGMIVNQVQFETANGSAYSAAKAGVLHLTRSQAMQWARHGIRVNAISPGYVRSGIHKGFGPEQFEVRARQVPLKRFGEVDEMAGAIVYLASGASAYVTGANLVIDGGYTCW